MSVVLTTTGLIATVTIDDLGGRDYVHPITVEMAGADVSEYTYEEVRESFDLGVALDNGYISITNDGEVVGDSDALKLVQPKVTAVGNVNPSNVGGGAASMVMSFASGNISYIEGNSSTYQKLASFIYGGTDSIGAIIKINVNAWITNNGTVDVRLVCCGDGSIVAEFLGIDTQDENNLVNMGTISNLPTTSDFIEIQGRKVAGGGASKLRIGSVELEY
jgi:hypothetical protein